MNSWKTGELQDFWAMEHSLYTHYPLRIRMQEGQWAFTSKAGLHYRGIECFVTGTAKLEGSQEEKEVELPMMEAESLWMDMYLRVVYRSGREIVLEPGFWYFTIRRGVPQELVRKQYVLDDELGRTRLVETPITFNDVRALGWRSGLNTEAAEYVVREILRAKD